MSVIPEPRKRFLDLGWQRIYSCAGLHCVRVSDTFAFAHAQDPFRYAQASDLRPRRRLK